MKKIIFAMVVLFIHQSHAVKNAEIKRTLVEYKTLGGHWASKGAIEGATTNNQLSWNKDALLDQAKREALREAATFCQLGTYSYRGNVTGYIGYLALIKSQTGCKLTYPADSSHADLYTCDAMALVNCNEEMRDHNGTPDLIIE